ncbi:MAG: alpha/beta hydrolase fold domain-containing protein [Planctomycetes bacterium]|nr:alpha/beta hydrolase fold domain-containing protein [Planctomycetota bacterium]
MSRFRSVAGVLGLALLVGWMAGAGAADQPPRPGVGGFGPIPPGALEKLNLTSEQKDKVKELMQEFRENHQEEFAQLMKEGQEVRAAMAEAQRNQDGEAMDQARQKAQQLGQRMGKMGREFETKFLTVLTDEQKKQYQELKRQRPGAVMGGIASGQNLPFIALLGRLNLTDEQKEKITQLHREFEARVMDVLTEEQKKQLEELKQRGPQPGAPAAKDQRGEKSEVHLPPGVKMLRDLAYVPDGHERHLLDLYLPEKADGPLPLIVWIHGGGWQAGNKDHPPGLPLVSKGYALASINYRLSQHAKFPAQIEDCKAAIRWLRANASKYHLDPKRIGVWGASAGGHLVALLGTTGGVKALEGDEGNLKESSRVQAVVDWFGPTDFMHLKTQGAQSPVTALLGGSPEVDPEKAREASPITYVGKDDPPFLIMHGDKDPLVPLKQSQELYQALKKAGVDATLEVIPGAGHGFGGPDINRKVEEFFDKHLKEASTSKSEERD